LIYLAVISLLIWLYLMLFRNRFWQSDQVINSDQINIFKWPSVVCVIPARDEAESIGRAVRSLLDQAYAGPLSIVVVDDNSTDGTADAARAVLRDKEESERVVLVDGAPLEDGWTGKIWAVSQGIASADGAEYILMTDADVEHEPDAVSRLVGKAVTERLGLVSMMVKLRCISTWERFLIPAFIYFFQKLYPFPKVNDPKSDLAAAAGGCMLVHAKTLETAGGIRAIRNCVIDDCALARLIKPHRPVWLGLAEKTHSLRAYDSLAPIWRMVARTAYVQLNHNPVWLVGTVVGMFMLYLLPLFAVVIGLSTENLALAGLGAAAWLVMAWTYLPTLELYRLNPLWALSLPIAGAVYTLMTLDSARLHYLGRGGAWKGRTYS
jgi:hopene-associated glycosyltransferase HpnB